MKKVEIVQDPKNKVPVQVLAASLLEMAKAAKVITQGKLTRNCLAALIKDRTGISKAQILIVLEAIDTLEKDWLK